MAAPRWSTETKCSSRHVSSSSRGMAGRHTRARRCASRRPPGRARRGRPTQTSRRARPSPSLERATSRRMTPQPRPLDAAERERLILDHMPLVRALARRTRTGESHSMTSCRSGRSGSSRRSIALIQHAGASSRAANSALLARPRSSRRRPRRMPQPSGIGRPFRTHSRSTHVRDPTPRCTRQRRRSRWLACSSDSLNLCTPNQ